MCMRIGYAISISVPMMREDAVRMMSRDDTRRSWRHKQANHERFVQDDTSLSCTFNQLIILLPTKKKPRSVMKPTRRVEQARHG